MAWHADAHFCARIPGRPCNSRQAFRGSSPAKIAPLGSPFSAPRMQSNNIIPLGDSGATMLRPFSAPPFDATSEPGDVEGMAGDRRLG
jgi:hypothetical protein